MKRTILSLCDHTGTWSRPYERAGYDVVRVDIQDGRDVRTYRHDGDVHGILMAPPCTHFSGSGAQYWKAKDEDGRTQSAVDLVHACLDHVERHRPSFWCLENPVGRLKRWIGEPRLRFNPCDYGGLSLPDPGLTEILTDMGVHQDIIDCVVSGHYSKKTCLWGDFNASLIQDPVAPLYRTVSNGDRYSPVNMLTGGKSEKTKFIRSITPSGFAQAFFLANL